MMNAPNDSTLQVRQRWTIKIKMMLMISDDDDDLWWWSLISDDDDDRWWPVLLRPQRLSILQPSPQPWENPAWLAHVNNIVDLHVLGQLLVLLLLDLHVNHLLNIERIQTDLLMWRKKFMIPECKKAHMMKNNMMQEWYHLIWRVFFEPEYLERIVFDYLFSFWAETK